MSFAFTCPDGATQNPDGTLACPEWVLVEMSGPDLIHQLTPQQMTEITGSILLSFAVAWSFRVLIRFILESNFGRNQ